MEQDRLDLSRLETRLDDERFERIVGAILQRARPELARRAARAGLLATLGDWLWPAMAAAALAAMASGAVLTRTVSTVTDPLAFAGGVVPALDVAEPVADWLDEGRSPQIGDLILVMEGRSR